MCQEKRFGLFKKHQKSIKQLWTELEVDPCTDFEITLCNEEADQYFCLSTENLEKLTNLETQVAPLLFSFYQPFITDPDN